MTTPVIFHRLAIQDLRRAVRWYSQRSSAATLRFRAAIDVAVERIRTQSNTLERLGPHFRWVRVAKFPFMLIFTPRLQGGYLIVAVAHTSRRRGYWRGRKADE